MSLRDEIQKLLLALSLLTRIPIGKLDLSRADLAASTVYFPIVGAGIGALGAIFFWACHIFFSIAISVSLTLGFLMLLTGALHEDGLADSFDAFGSKVHKKEILEVMRDSRIGTYGSLALIMIVLGKFSVLQEMQAHTIVLALVMSHLVSRWAILPPTLLLSYPRKSASWTKRFVERIALSSKRNLVYATIYTVALLILLFGWSGLVVFFLAIVISLLGVVYFKRRLQGATGDCYGALQQVVELVVYLAVLKLI